MKKIYFIGAGGIGMSAIVRYYNYLGSKTAGYDKTPSLLTQQLQQEGTDIHFTDDEAMIPEEFKNDKENTLVVYTPAIPSDSPELKWFMDNGFRVIKRSEALEKISADKRTLAVAGTHGKTTTSTMLAHILNHSGVECTAFLGGISLNYNTNLLISKNNILVAEADEFDRSFLKLWPYIAVITSTDADHLDIYENHDSLKGAFKAFAAQVSEIGSLIVKTGTDKEIISKCKARVYYYSYDKKCDFYASDIVEKEGGFFDFTLNYPQGRIEGCSIGVPGWINVENAIAASAVSILQGVNPERLKEALLCFKGVARRFDIKINNPVCSYIDDYAHHPKEIEAAISSMRNIFGKRKLTVVFQPHLYTRTRDFASGFAESLSLSDELILLDIYPAREKPIEGITSKVILDMATVKEKVLIGKEELLDNLKEREIDVLVTFGAGDIDRLVQPITEYLKERYNV